MNHLNHLLNFVSADKNSNCKRGQFYNTLVAIITVSADLSGATHQFLSVKSSENRPLLEPSFLLSESDDADQSSSGSFPSKKAASLFDVATT